MSHSPGVAEDELLLEELVELDEDEELTDEELLELDEELTLEEDLLLELNDVDDELVELELEDGQSTLSYSKTLSDFILVICPLFPTSSVTVPIVEPK